MCSYFLKDLKRFADKKAFVGLVFVSNFLRDVVPMAIAIVFQLFLIYFLHRYKSRNTQLTGRENVTLNSLEFANLITSFILCILSIVMHSLVFLVTFFRVFYN